VKRIIFKQPFLFLNPIIRIWIVVHFFEQRIEWIQQHKLSNFFQIINPFLKLNIQII